MLLLNKKFIAFVYILMFVALCVGGWIISTMISEKNYIKAYPYVSGRYGTNCYNRLNSHGNIKYHKYYKTKKECEEYIIINQ